MRKVLSMVLVALLLLTFVAGAQESEAREPMITADVGLLWPTYLGVGMYWPNNFFELSNGILSGIELSFAYGSQLKAPIIFANKDQNELTEHKYYNFPDPAPTSLGRGWGLRTYLTAYELGLGFGTLPIKAGFYIGGGSIKGPDDETYMTIDFMLTSKVEAELDAFTLLKPYVELGIGLGEASPMSDAAKEAVSGLTTSVGSNATSGDDYTKWFFSAWKYTNILFNVGVRYELPVFWGKSRDAEEVEEVAAEPEPVVDTRESEFLFPKWFMDLGGLSHFPSGNMNPMEGSIILGPQKMFRNYSFKHQSTVRSDSFNFKFEPEAIVEIVQADETMWHAKLRTETGEVVEYQIHRLQAGVTVTIDGNEITPDVDGVYYDGMVFHTIAPTMQ